MLNLVKVRTQLEAEHSRSQLPAYEDTTFFIATDLSLSDHEAHTKGKLNDFLEDLFSNRKFQLSTIYRAIFDEIKRKNNYDTLPSNFLELIDRKSIGKTSFQTMLDALGIRTDLDEGWETLEARLQAEQFPLSSLIRVKTQWKRYEVDRMDATNLVIQRLKKLILSVVSAQSITTSLTKFIETAYESCRKEPNSPVTGLRSEYVQAAILVEHYEQLKLSEVDPKSEEEEA